MPKNNILVLNSGSSSLKFSIINLDEKKEYLSGLAECLNTNESRIKWALGGVKYTENLPNANHETTIKFFTSHILANEMSLLSSIKAIGHRVAHGGEKYVEEVLINDEVIDEINKVSCFAPLHNPANLVGIKAAMKSFPDLKNKNVAVFDTSFHTTLPKSAYLYALPIELYQKYGIRRYGFHGISHYYVMQQASICLGKDPEQLNLITCHLGNGCSVTAIKNGLSVDTSMGFTPNEGLMMGTRTGDLDANILLYLQENLGLSPNEVSQMINKQSGILGLTQITNDFRYLAEHQSEEEIGVTLDIFVHKLAKYIGGYSTLLDGKLDAIVFTGGIGENSALLREKVLNKLSILGFEVDVEANNSMVGQKMGVITRDDAERKALVIPTNEELVIAQKTDQLINRYII
ncbi:acetate kinase [Lonepinella koalarum]|uniref:Acetate kinase n=1 Tax=Lonepinella koalarum TaxID=53417 RepID=A0A4R1KR40_9PAST|nr:acetate kinase [Lonepinella koalarum]MDH2926663.1 acetate kinase [Lonepinella koalarum]TCK66987.1 acetate kinase [Lonepinella koalarum]TFJ88944.1 acetate kinase [Lonepinella koalarum]